MLNRYQTNVVGFFHPYAELFIKQLLISLPASYTFVDDVFPRIINFIDNEIHKEMAMHDVKSDGYNYYVDMLIEIHASHLSDDFKTAIINEINALFRD